MTGLAQREKSLDAEDELTRLHEENARLQRDELIEAMAWR